jgi:pyruvate-ferredoxin/flavodoxin oxidoreductase
MIAMSYGYGLHRQIALGANMGQAIKAIAKPRGYSGPSIISPTRTASNTAST